MDSLKMLDAQIIEAAARLHEAEARFEIVSVQLYRNLIDELLDIRITVRLGLPMRDAIASALRKLGST